MTTIHGAALSDCEGIYPLICQLASGGLDGSGGDYRPTYKDYERTYRSILNDASKKYFVAKIDERIVGVAGLSLNQSLCEASYFANIEELAVDEAARRQGVGQQLLNACMAYSKAQGCTSLALTTGNNRHAAQGLYEKNGFKKTGIKYVLEAD
ncbi:MAG: GNAT family N-acetyltransferase [Oscillospiraceae bacterium]|nr:GNAT family N-acetyltransferase [Oscillospiraceae bacterium]